MFIFKALAYFNGVSKLSQEDTAKVVAAKTPLHLNLSVCYLKLDEVSKSIKHAEKVKIYILTVFLFLGNRVGRKQCKSLF
jgi:hypothetical protein